MGSPTEVLSAESSAQIALLEATQTDSPSLTAVTVDGSITLNSRYKIL